MRAIIIPLAAVGLVLSAPAQAEEKTYDITIAEEELADLTNLKAVYDKVQEKLGEAG